MNSYMNNGTMMTSGPVARWLDTFVCRQYADIFKKFGFDTLNDVRTIYSNLCNLLLVYYIKYIHDC